MMRAGVISSPDMSKCSNCDFTLGVIAGAASAVVGIIIGNMIYDWALTPLFNDPSPLESAEGPKMRVRCGASGYVLRRDDDGVVRLSPVDGWNPRADLPGYETGTDAAPTSKSREDDHL